MWEEQYNRISEKITNAKNNKLYEILITEKMHWETIRKFENNDYLIYRKNKNLYINWEYNLRKTVF